MANVNPGIEETDMVFMPSKRQSRTKSLTVHVDGEPLTFNYRPSVVTPKLLEEFTSGGDEQGHHQIARQITTFVASWEIGEPVMNGATDEFGNPLPKRDEHGEIVYERWPVDVDHAMQLDLGVLMEIMRAIGDDLRPGETIASD